jgi:two-component system chemotaxis response regulator CheB
MGASAGGIPACCDILGGLPADLPASIFIVQHVASVSSLGEVLARCDGLKVATAADGEPVRQSRAYVAPGDQHLLLNDGHVRLSRGPRENRQRPSVDVLFRSASRTYGSRVIAVVLSGALDDGSAGVFAVKQRGGTVVVQDPRSAQFSSMPENALQAAKADYCVPLAQIASLLVKLVNEDTIMPKHKKPRRPAKPPRTGLAPAAAAPFVCPECSGPLFPVKGCPPGQLACLVGHSFAPESLSEAHREALERALLTTMRLLQERAGLHKHLARATHAGRNGHRQERFRECAEAAEKDTVLLREILERI